MDYSLERLASAVETTENTASIESSASRNLYRHILHDMAVEEAAKEKVDYKNLALLELASRSLDEAVDDKGLKRANLYLKQIFKDKQAERNALFGILDSLSRSYQHILANFVKSFKSITGKTDKPKTAQYSGILILNEAEDKVKKMDLAAGAELYQKYLMQYPNEPEAGIVMTSLAEIYIRQQKLDDAAALLKKTSQRYAGNPEAATAVSMLRKVGQIQRDMDEAKTLEAQTAAEKDGAKAEALKLKLALKWISSYDLERAEVLLQEMQNSKNPETVKSAKFYLGWLYKAKSKFEDSAEVLSKLLDDTKADDEMKVGIQAQLADVYYQKGDVEKSLQQYENITREVSKKGPTKKEIEQEALREVWRGVSELELAKLYYYDNTADSKDTRFTSPTASNFKSEFAKLSQEFTNSLRVRMRDQAFSNLEHGRIRQALELFEKDINRYPQDPWTFSGLATAYTLLGDLKRGTQYAEKGYALRRDEYTASTLAYLRALVQRNEEAIGLYQEAIGRRHNYVPAEFNLAALYLKTARYQEGLNLLKAMREHITYSQKLMKAKILNNIGYALWQLGDRQNAIVQFRESSKMFPSFAVAQNNLKQAVAGAVPELANLRE